MDEIDAALDFKNVSIVANYIKERTKNAQFIIIRYLLLCASLFPTASEGIESFLFFFALRVERTWAA